MSVSQHAQSKSGAAIVILKFACLKYLCVLQDVVAGDGTTSVTVICGALLRKCLELLEKGVHPTVISDSFAKAAAKAEEILEGVAIPVDLGDRESLIKAANTCAAASPALTVQRSMHYKDSSTASCSRTRLKRQQRSI
jgi:hypothetical protein